LLHVPAPVDELGVPPKFIPPPVDELGGPPKFNLIPVDAGGGATDAVGVVVLPKPNPV
jgi:hypothetical protein